MLARIINNTQGYLPSIKAYISSPDDISGDSLRSPTTECPSDLSPKDFHVSGPRISKIPWDLWNLAHVEALSVDTRNLNWARGFLQYVYVQFSLPTVQVCFTFAPF